MSDSGKELLVVLHTGLFPDAATLDQAVSRLEQGHAVRRHDLTQPSLDAATWDQVLADILAARKIITI